MKIYFGGSVRSGRGNKEWYARIIQELKNYGTVLTEHIGDPKLTEAGENRPVEFIYQRDANWVKTADVLVADVSNPSVGVGYEIGLAESLNKPILCLYRVGSEKRLSGMIEGNKNLQVGNYANLMDIKKILKDFFASC